MVLLKLLLVLLFFVALCLLPGILVARSLAQRPGDSSNSTGRALVGGGVSLVTTILVVSAIMSLYYSG